MPTVSSVGTKKLAMFATRTDIVKAAPGLNLPRYHSLALERYFHSGDSLRSIAQRFSLPRNVVALLGQEFAFGAMLFRSRPAMMDWLITQSSSIEREIFGYYRKSGSGIRLWGNLGWASAAPALATRKMDFHTHPSGGHDLSGQDVFSFLILGGQMEMTVASATGATVVRKTHPEYANNAGNYLRGLASTYARHQEMSSPADPSLLIREAGFSDVPTDMVPSMHQDHGRDFALQVLSEALTKEPFNLERLMICSGLEIGRYLQGRFVTTSSRPKFALVSKLIKDFLRDPLGIYLKLEADYVPHNAGMFEAVIDSPDAAAGEFVPVE